MLHACDVHVVYMWYACDMNVLQVIPLVENGEEKEVTEENKLEYLNALAHYRFTKRVSEEIAHFIKGTLTLDEQF